jgi:hypothetical protein
MAAMLVPNSKEFAHIIASQEFRYNVKAWFP